MIRVAFAYAAAALACAVGLWGAGWYLSIPILAALIPEHAPRLTFTSPDEIFLYRASVGLPFALAPLFAWGIALVHSLRTREPMRPAVLAGALGLLLAVAITTAGLRAWWMRTAIEEALAHPLIDGIEPMISPAGLLDPMTPSAAVVVAAVISALLGLALTTSRH
jgi:hypothetical protein